MCAQESVSKLENELDNYFIINTHPTKPIVLRLLYQSASFIMEKFLSY